MAGGGTHRRGGYYHHHRRPESTPEAPLAPCPVCQKPVRELSSAIAHRETGSPAHFDCILKVLRDEHQPADNENICYLGNGSFGVVQFRGGLPLGFFVRKRIQYEKTDAAPEWRRTIPRGAR
jgi:hypothetical protein